MSPNDDPVDDKSKTEVQLALNYLPIVVVDDECVLDGHYDDPVDVPDDVYCPFDDPAQSKTKIELE